MTGSVGIIGAGRLGQAMARTARRAGRDVVIANSRGPDSGDDVDAKAEVVMLFQDAGSPQSTSAAWPQAGPCSRSTTRSPAST